MKIKKPYFWDLAKPNLISFLLMPFSIPFVIRNFFFNIVKKKKRQKLKRFVLEIFILEGQVKLHLQSKYMKF